jgi:TolB-like protein/Tfp pilus assembly protein PilF
MVYQFGIDEKSGHSYYAMELVEGETLDERVRRSGPLDVETVIEIARQVTSALAAAEKHRLVHRDLKPANIMISDEDAPQGSNLHNRGRRNSKGSAQFTVKVIDFGLAKALAETTDARTLTNGGFVGTPAFASPEQLNSKPVDIRADIYSLGATLWYLLTGRMPFGHRSDTAPPVEQLKAARVPRSVITLLTSMLQSEPAARPGLTELAREIQRIQQSLHGQRRLAIAVSVAVMIILAGAGAILWKSPHTPVAPALPEKSIAVLPFTSLGDEKENGYLADSVQDEILTNLTKVADFTVISRRSAAQFRDTKQSAQAIGQALRVSHLLEGTVRKADDRIHVTVHLIDTRTGAESWSEKYERELADIFLVQSDIAQEVISRLKAELSPREKEAIEEKPTQDMTAYDLYLRARSLVYEAGSKTGGQLADDAKKAIDLLQQSIARDPNFALAYCVIADAELTIANSEWSYDETCKKRSREAIDAALRISPDSAEAHLARAQYLIEGLDDPAAGERDLAIAAAGLPGKAAVFTLRAKAEEQRGQWKEALRDLERAVQLDPRESGPGDELVQLLITLRRYPQAERLTDHMIAIQPKENGGRFWRLKSQIALARGDTKGAMAALDASPSRPLRLILFNELLANIWIMERNYSKAEEFFQSIIAPGKIPYVLPSERGESAELFLRGAANESLGRLARSRGEREKANKYFEAAAPYFEQWLGEGTHGRWGTGSAQAYLAQIDAALGRKEQAIRKGRSVVEYWSTHDARVAPDTKIRLAITYLWSGEREAALQELSEVVKAPAWTATPPFCPGMSAGELQLNPVWDELRSDSRFKNLIAEAARPVSL